MRSRTVREGSVGLLILLGLGLFVFLILWLRGLTVGKRSYNAIVDFSNAGGMQEGATVRYRGVDVGKISNIQPGPNGVEVSIEITPADVVIPRDVLIEANQAGLISEVSLDLTPRKPIPAGVAIAKPTDENCDRNLIICDGSRLQGQIGISTYELFRATTRFADVYSNPELYTNASVAAKNASVAAAGAAQLTRDLSSLTKATRQQLNSVSTTATSVQRAANQISSVTSNTANQFGTTAVQLRLTTAQVQRLVTNIDSLLATNRNSLINALNNINQTSDVLRTAANGLAPAVNRVTQGELIQNLETLSANAAQASANLRDISNTLNSPTNALVLQQTLDSARVTFQNAQKLTSDLDELTGDPAFRQNLRELVNGLSSLVSSTQQLEQQVQVAQTLDSLTAAVKTSEVDALNLAFKNKSIPIKPTFDSTISIKGDLQPITPPPDVSKELGKLEAEVQGARGRNS